MMDRLALIIGAMKCGTTSLFSYLAQHPQIATSTPKEPNFFASDEHWARGMQWYRSLFDWDPSRHTIALEASTAYTKLPTFPNAAERIATLETDCRFIYLLRDPVDRVESTLKHAVLRGWTTVRSGEEPELRTRWIDPSRYAMQAAEYTKRFPREHLLLLDFDELKAQPLVVVRRVCAFLDVDPSYDFKGLSTTHNPSRVDHPFYTAAVRNSLARTVARLLPVRVKQSLRNRMASKLDVAVALSPEQRARLSDELKEDMDRLQEEFDFDVSKWCRPEPGK